MQIVIVLTALVTLQCYHVSADNPKDYKKAKSVYEFTVTDIQGNEVSLDKYKGNVLIIVNVASNCDLTLKNYAHLNNIYQKYANKGLKILGFPCNQFEQHESGTNQEIAEFVNFLGVKFDMFSKSEVNGEGAIPLYKYLKYKQPGPKHNDTSVEWNFAKFIVDRNGQVVARHHPREEPLKIFPSIDKYI